MSKFFMFQRHSCSPLDAIVTSVPQPGGCRVDLCPATACRTFHSGLTVHGLTTQAWRTSWCGISSMQSMRRLPSSPAGRVSALLHVCVLPFDACPEWDWPVHVVCICKLSIKCKLFVNCTKPRRTCVCSCRQVRVHHVQAVTACAARLVASHAGLNQTLLLLISQ